MLSSGLEHLTRAGQHTYLGTVGHRSGHDCPCRHHSNSRTGNIQAALPPYRQDPGTIVGSDDSVLAMVLRNSGGFARQAEGVAGRI